MLNTASIAGLDHTAARAAPGTDPTRKTFELLQENVPMKRRIVQAGDRVHQVGQRLEWLHVIHSGSFKTVNLSRDGREQVVGLHLKGDWLGFDGMAKGR